MSSGTAALVALLLYGVGLAPVAVMAYRPRTARWLAPLGGLLVLVTALVQTGIFDRGELAPTDVDDLVQVNSLDGTCGQIFDVLEENGVLLGSDRRGIVVQGQTWDQLPAQLKEAVIGCVQNARPSPSGEVEIIRR